jgi:hypothetical protein
MRISRRNFVASLSVSLFAGIPAAAGSGGTGLVSSLLKSPVGSLDTDALFRMTWNTFFPYIDTEFEFARGTRRGRIGAVPLTLSAMTSGPIGGGKVDRAEPACFHLTFKRRADVDFPRLFQNTYTVVHFALGSFDLFISDADLVDGEYIHTAVINRVTE